MPTTTRSAMAEVGDEVQGIAPPGQVIIYAVHHHGAAVTRRSGTEFLGREPNHAQDAGIELALRERAAQLPAEGEAKIGALLLGVMAVVDAHQFGGSEFAGRLFQGLARAGLHQRLARLPVPGRLVEYQAAARGFLDEQEAPLPFDYGGD